MKFELNPFFQALAAVLIIVGGVFLLFGVGPVQQNSLNDDTDVSVGGQEMLDSKSYVAVEGESKMAVIDPIKRVVIKNINLAMEHDGGLLGFTPHNVQVSPDNKTVWVTANSGAHSDHGLINFPKAYAHGEEETESLEFDQVIIIDPDTDSIVKRVPIAQGIHLAHAVLTPDSKYAYITAQNEGVVYKINVKIFEAIKKIETREGGQPHGLRISPDGRYAYIAMLGSKALGIIDLLSDNFFEVSLDGAAVQVGVTPDNEHVVASLYDTRQLAVYGVSDKSISYIKLPENAKGPIQMYSTPDSRFIYLADQGYYFEQPSSEWVYKIDLEVKKIVKEIRAGKAPHGVVVSDDGKFVYVTNLLSKDVSVIDVEKDEEVERIKVGKEPNGISIWYKK